MKKIIGSICAIVLATATVANAQDAKLQERLDSATTVLHEIMSTPDKGIPQQILAGASCVAVIPSYKKAAFIVGADYGQGVATCRTHHGWSAPSFVRMSGGSFGFQIGGQATDLVIVAMNYKGMQDMLASKLKLGGNASVAAGPVGRDANAATNWKLQSEFLSYSRSKGLFAGIDLTGADFSQNKDDNRAYYGEAIPMSTLLDGHAPVPAGARRFVGTVARYFVVSMDNS
jgi:lipid-binding SYLF domain-containing protein